MSIQILLVLCYISIISVNVIHYNISEWVFRRLLGFFIILHKNSKHRKEALPVSTVLSIEKSSLDTLRTRLYHRPLKF